MKRHIGFVTATAAASILAVAALAWHASRPAPTAPRGSLTPSRSVTSALTHRPNLVTTSRSLPDRVSPSILTARRATPDTRSTHPSQVRPRPAAAATTAVTQPPELLRRLGSNPLSRNHATDRGDPADSSSSEDSLGALIRDSLALELADDARRLSMTLPEHTDAEFRRAIRHANRNGSRYNRSDPVAALTLDLHVDGGQLRFDALKLGGIDIGKADTLAGRDHDLNAIP